MQRTLALVKPCSFPRGVAALEAAARLRGLTVARRRTLSLSLEDAERFYAEHRGRFFFQRLVGFMSEGPVEAVELHGPGAIAQWRDAIGPTHLERAQRMPSTLRAQFATSDTRNAFHGSDSEQSAAREIDFFFKQ